MNGRGAPPPPNLQFGSDENKIIRIVIMNWGGAPPPPNPPRGGGLRPHPTTGFFFKPNTHAVEFETLPSTNIFLSMLY